MQTQALNCPNCGAAVASDRTQCEFCKSRLKTVACPSCLGLMFLGSKFCGHCGARAVGAEIADEDAGACPRCKHELQLIKIDSTNIRECTSCGGLWANTDTFEDLCANKEQQSAVLNYVGSQTRAAPLSIAPISYVPCPICKLLMNRSNFARISGVIIDLCKQHGVWFDADELPKIIDFIDKGGLVRSREKEKISLEDERSHLREEQRQFAMMERRSGAGRFSDDSEKGFGGVISALFDL